MGQMRDDVELAVRCRKPVDLCARAGGTIPTPKEVMLSNKAKMEEKAKKMSEKYRLIKK